MNSKKKIVIVIPTYNERDNTERMIKALDKQITEITDHDVQVLYVDDNSPDKTYELVRQESKRYPWLHLLFNQEKKGLGKAYAKGFQYAIEHLGADYVMEFDADFQHRPDQIKDLVAKINEGYEYIIGSRYIPGGSIPKAWGTKRKLLSIVGNLVARIGLLMPKVHDLTTGFKITKVKGVLDKIDLDNLYSNSFAYKVQILGEAIINGAKWVEVPITFEPRTEGESKIIKNELFETLRVIFLVQWHNPKLKKFIRFFKFLIVGGTGLFLQTLIYYLLGFSFKVLSPAAATIVGGQIAIFSNFILNNLWTFKDRKLSRLGAIIKKLILFYLTSNIAVLVIQGGTMKIGEAIVGQENLLIHGFYILSMVLTLIFNFTIYNKYIWKTSKK